MKFWEAMICYEHGKKVRCKDWPENRFCHKVKDNTSAADRMNLWFDKDKEWEIYEEPQKTYTFMEAVQLMKQGKKMGRKNLDGFLNMYDDEKIWFITTANEESYKIFLRGLKLQDVEATDWVVVE